MNPLKFLILILCSLVLTLESLVAQQEAELLPEGIVFPRLTTSQRDGLSAIRGQCVYNSSLDRIECFDGTSWIPSVQQLSVMTGEVILPRLVGNSIGQTGIINSPIFGFVTWTIEELINADLSSGTAPRMEVRYVFTNQITNFIDINLQAVDNSNNNYVFSLSQAGQATSNSITVAFCRSDKMEDWNTDSYFNLSYFIN